LKACETGQKQRSHDRYPGEGATLEAQREAEAGCVSKGRARRGFVTAAG